jgi:hypothetical protein
LDKRWTTTREVARRDGRTAFNCRCMILRSKSADVR